MFVELVVLFGVSFNGYDAFLLDEPCNRTITTAEIDFIIGQDCSHGVISINPSASGTLSAYFANKSPRICSNTVCLRSCNTVSSSVFALPQDPFICCHKFPRPTIVLRDSTDGKNESLHTSTTLGDDWICTRPHSQQRAVIDAIVHTSHCPVEVEYNVFDSC